MGVMSGILANANAIKRDLADIKDVANEKGANIVNGDDLNTWAGKIGNIQNAVPPKSYGIGTPPQPFSIQIAKKVVFPTEDMDGTPFSNAMAPSSNNALTQVLIYGCEEVEFPGYFQTVTFTNIFPSEITNNDQIAASALKRVIVRGTAIEGGRISIAPKLEYLQVDAETINNMMIYYKPVRPQLEWNFPNAKTLTLGNRNNNLTDTKLILNAPNLERLDRLSTSSIAVTGLEYAYGTFVLPKLKVIGDPSSTSAYGITGYKGTTEKQVWRMPLLERVSVNTVFNSSNTKTELYIGQNLHFMTGNGITNWKSYITNGLLEIHIPEGDSTTKTYFDSNGITYIQDYDYEADL